MHFTETFYTLMDEIQDPEFDSYSKFAGQGYPEQGPWKHYDDKMGNHYRWYSPQHVPRSILFGGVGYGAVYVFGSKQQARAWSVRSDLVDGIGASLKVVPWQAVFTTEGDNLARLILDEKGKPLGSWEYGSKPQEVAND
jgi:hypothetical protein